MRKSIAKITAFAKSKAIGWQNFHRRALSGRSGEGYIDTAVKILIAVVLGAMLLAALYKLFGETIMPTVTSKITEMFNYAGDLS